MLPLPPISLLYTSARPHLVPHIIGVWLSQADHPASIEVVITTDEWHPDLDQHLRNLAGQWQNALVYLKNPGPANCVAGWNWAAKHAMGHRFVQVSDDFTPPPGWDTTVIQRLPEDLPCGLSIRDGFTATDEFIPHVLCTRRFYNQWGYLFHPSYESMCCDLEYSAVLIGLNQRICAPDVVFCHSPEQRHTDDITQRHASEDRLDKGMQVAGGRKQFGFQRWVYVHPSDETHCLVDWSDHVNPTLVSSQRHWSLPAPNVSSSSPEAPLLTILLAEDPECPSFNQQRQNYCRQLPFSATTTLVERIDAANELCNIDQLVSARGSYVICLDADWCPTDALFFELIAATRTNPEAPLLLGDLLLPDRLYVTTATGSLLPLVGQSFPTVSVGTPTRSMIWHREGLINAMETAGLAYLPSMTAPLIEQQRAYAALKTVWPELHTQWVQLNALIAVHRSYFTHPVEPTFS